MKISYVIFDLGGVLIELDGPPLAPESSEMTVPEVWESWLKSTAVRRYESGKINRDEFADQIIKEFSLNSTPTKLLAYFEAWPKGYFTGAEALLERLRPNIPMAYLSNTNELHWHRFHRENRFDELFSHQFSSFQMGLLKPDPASFEHVVAKLDLPADELLFFDDNQLNVEAARKAGLKAELTRGITEVEAQLKDYELL